ncbi:MlaD/PqiB family protein [Paracoccus cavernae]|uniref:hypothetical protein n=1 Tax=Paracoccus cavernae TaxID=1571207 RepID=UPI003638220B
MNVSSVASLLQGGVEFATLTSGGRAVPQGHVFALQPSEAVARETIFVDEEDLVRLSVLIDGNVRGLATGADVKFQGLTVGRVTELSVKVDPDAEGGAGRIEQQVVIALTPSRLGLPAETTPEETLEFLKRRVEHGLRARLASAGFFGTSLIIDMIDVPDAPPATLDVAMEPFPVLPSVASDISDFRDTAQGFLARVGDLPIEEVLKSANDMMSSITAVASSEATRAIPESVRSAVEEMKATSAELRLAVTELRESGALGQVRGFVDEATAAAEAVKLAAADVPQMVENIDAAAVSFDEIDFPGISTEAKAILADLRAMLGSEDAEALPRNLSATLEAAAGLLNDLRDGNAAGSLNDALKSAKTAADQVAASVSRMPQLTARLERLVATADQVVGAYGARSDFNNEAINMMREFRRAADAFGNLARLIERNPAPSFWEDNDDA